MANSMTGFGRGEANGNGCHFTVELKSVNHRFLEVKVRLPKNYGIFEDRIRKIIQQNVRRGRVEVYLNITETEERKRLVKVDKDLALSYDKTLKELAAVLDTVYQADIFNLASLPEVLVIEEPEIDLESIWEVCSQALVPALDDLRAMRRTEGGKLAEDILSRLDLLAAEIAQIAARSDQVVIDYQNRLKERLQVLIGEAVVDEARMANEVAIFAERASITEELVRLDSHLRQCRSAFKSDDVLGRKLDFMIQEMNREINTIGSKANDLAISQAVVMLKSELEKVREQIQNVE
ncbi:MAG: YicC family protein [Desulfitobacteriaceae bacterium]|nr:YicC family protein [Desulfitobacteriaceae bacterium]MDD4345662.1 YicC family protein [Desulfitobacteriaceae bacterium]MDD4400526.1 YicC family protein [Desulfitobacteriaceae bacterium]